MGLARIFCGIFLCVALSGVAGAAPFRVGVLPTNGTLFLLQLYKPFRVYLEGRLNVPVELYTASDYPAFLRQVQGKEFDLVVTAPHFAALAEEQSGYRGLVRFARKLQPVVVVAKDSPVQSPGQLRGGIIATPDRLAFVALGGVQWLAAGGLKEGRDFQLKSYGSHTNALFAVAGGEVAAAFSAEGPCTHLDAEVRSRIRYFPIGQPMPHLVVLARAGLPSATFAALRESLAAFPASEEGRVFFAESGYGGFIPLTPADHRAIRPYAREASRILEPVP